MRLYRLGSARHPVWDGAGAALVGGRWNVPGEAVIYAAGSLALAMLERLVQRQNLGGTLLVAAEAPDHLLVEYLTDPPPGWRELGSPEAAALGTAWLRSGRTALLAVPSAVVPREHNFLVNPAHPEAARIAVDAPAALVWDARLFGIPAP
jgi:RES domain-containing protein